MERSQKQSLRLDSQGRVLIPKSLRKAMGVAPGAEIVAWLDESRLVLESRAALLERVKARYRDVDGSMADELIRERRQEAAREAEE